ncbi:hypothetical protein DL96DRAFT_1601645 [Flagelloscypha sp. PMI_526]|nr:hypothetical protein DL96DRAFT_1601645 [Flagelloscypha sp. PMI_526]
MVLSTEDFDQVVQEEKEHLQKIYPLPENIPTCFQHFDRILDCGGPFLKFCTSLWGPCPLFTRFVILGWKAQVKSIYRYGKRPDCDWHIEEFKKCLTMKLKSPEDRRDIWIQRRAEWWAKRRIEKSSEDVWDARRPNERLTNWPCSPDAVFGPDVGKIPRQSS